MATLFYSERCKFCYDIIEFIKTKPALHSIVRYHNVEEGGIPQGVTKVPSLVTSDGKLYVGKQVREYLQSLVPDTVERFQFTNAKMKRLDNKLPGKYFSVNDYGNRIVKPEITEELKAKVERPIADGLASLKR